MSANIHDFFLIISNRDVTAPVQIFTRPTGWRLCAINGSLSMQNQIEEVLVLLAAEMLQWPMTKDHELPRRLIVRSSHLHPWHRKIHQAYLPLVP